MIPYYIPLIRVHTLLIYTDDFGISGHAEAALLVWRLLQKELKFEDKADMQLDDMVGIERTVLEKTDEYTKILVH